MTTVIRGALGEVITAVEACVTCGSNMTRGYLRCFPCSLRRLDLTDPTLRALLEVKQKVLGACCTLPDANDKLMAADAALAEVFQQLADARIP